MERVNSSGPSSWTPISKGTCIGRGAAGKDFIVSAFAVTDLQRSVESVSGDGNSTDVLMNKDQLVFINETDFNLCYLWFTLGVVVLEMSRTGWLAERWPVAIRSERGEKTDGVDLESGV
jgi:hypothetical protein